MTRVRHTPPAAGAAASQRALQLRRLSDPQPARSRRSRSGDVPASLPLLAPLRAGNPPPGVVVPDPEEHVSHVRSEEHTSELQSRFDLVCRLLLEKKNKQ